MHAAIEAWAPISMAISVRLGAAWGILVSRSHDRRGAQLQASLLVVRVAQAGEGA